MPVFAGISVAALLGLTVYEMYNANLYAAPAPEISARSVAGSGQVGDAHGSALYASAAGAPTTTLSDVVFDTLASQYVALKNQGLYTPDAGQAVGESLAKGLQGDVPSRQYTLVDIRTDADTSPTRVMQYRADLTSSLAPITKNTEPEFITFGRYVETGDESYLRALRNAAGNYRAAAEATAIVIAPADAASAQLTVVNALEQFAATLDAMADNAQDPFAAVALLKNYNDAESALDSAIKTLNAYEDAKKI